MQTNYRKDLEAIDELLDGRSVAEQCDILKAAMDKHASRLNAVQELAAMRDRLTRLLEGIDPKAKCLIHVLAEIATLESAAPSLEYGRRLLLEGTDASTMKIGASELRADPQWASVEWAHGLVARIRE